MIVQQKNKRRKNTERTFLKKDSDTTLWWVGRCAVGVVKMGGCRRGIWNMLKGGNCAGW
ncbi:MAG: hypothetical protein ACI8V2_003484 [Candidatus Latescibacterota bacterium]|jgi:hypothetical protein